MFNCSSHRQNRGEGVRRFRPRPKSPISVDLFCPARRRCVCFALLGLFLGSGISHGQPADTSHAKSLSRAFRQAAAQVKPAVVTIIAMKRSQRDAVLRQLLRERLRGEVPFDLPAEDSDQPLHPETGSGVIIESSGLVLTNNHVVQGAEEVVVRLHDGSEIKVKEVKGDPLSDLAILAIDTDLELPVAPLGNSELLEIGDWVIAIGSPFELEATVSAGIISAKGRSIDQIKRAQLIQTDAAINPGNSGGPLVNLDGEVVGINTAIATVSGGYQGVGFAVPVNKAKWVVQQLKANGAVRRAWLGIGIGQLDADVARNLNLPTRSGVWVERVFPNSPAAKADLSAGDVIVEFGGKRVRSPGDLQGIVEQMPLESEQKIVVLRDGKRVPLSVTVTSIKAIQDAQSSEQEPLPRE